ncbi:MAG: hypothetical protein K2K56_02455 [Lachnospiraceae bacterium]|nr:hypothetical protein [Lachnospiraceae bacterium]
MAEKNSILTYVKYVLMYMAVEFTMCMTVCVVVWKIAGMTEMKINTIFSLMLVCLFMSFMQSIAFTELWIKKMHYGLRMMIFAFPSLAFMSLIAWKFQWFPTAEMASWLIFVGIFIACFIISAILYEIYFRMTGKKYDGLLGEYHRKHGNG